MEKIKLNNGHVYELAVNGVIETPDALSLTFLPADKTFEEIERDFETETATEKICVLDSADQIMYSVIGFSRYCGMAKKPDYVISTEQVNKGSEEEPVMETVEKIGAVMVVELSRPDLEKKYADLKETVEFLVLSQLGA